MAGCGEQPAGGRRPNMDKESDQQGPESSDDQSAAPHEEKPEYPLEKKQVPKRTNFTAAQLNTLEALFNDKVYLSTPEAEQLATHLSVPQRSIQKWFEHRRAKVKHQALNSKKTPVQDQKKLDQRGPESSDDRSAADTECLLNKIQLHKRTFFPEEQQNILEALFKKKPYLNYIELEELANHLSVSRRKIQIHYKYGKKTFDDRSAADTEYFLNQIQLHKRTLFPEAQQKILEALFKKKPYLSSIEGEQLANQLCVSRRKIQRWFQYQRDKMRHEALNPKKTPVQDQAGNSKTPTQAQQDLRHKQKMEASIKCVQAQEQSYLDGFPPPRPMGSYVLPQGPHSSNMVYCQNVGGPPDSNCGTEVYKMLPESGHKPPNALHFNLPGTSIWTPVPPVTIGLTSDDGPSTSSAQMPIAPDNAYQGSSTDPYLLTDVETTDSDWENCSPC